MSMDHAAAHERIEDLLREPGLLADLQTSSTPDDMALQDHVAGCSACRADLEAWRGLQLAIRDALPATEGAARAAVMPVELRASLRAATIDAIHRPTRSAIVRRIGPARDRPRLMAWLSLAASIVVLAGAGLLTVDQVIQRATAEADSRALTSAIAAVNRVLAQPNHRAVALNTPSGAPAGSISWSSHDLVVLTTALTAPPAGERYRCWLVAGDHSVGVGWMYFAGQTAYWVGSLDEWVTFQIGPTTRFVVTLEPAGSMDRTGADVLSANLGS